MLIKNDLDVATLRIAFSQLRRVTVRNFLEGDVAQSIFRFLNDSMPEDWWWRSTLINAPDYPSVLNLRRFFWNIPGIEQLSMLANRSFAKGIFSYAFDRTFRDHYKMCRCVLCELDGFFRGELLNFLNSITGCTAKAPKEIFATRYTSGCFLSPHSDAQKGQMGFVLNLTHKWKPEFGGNLHITSDDGSMTTEILVPEFNTLYVFGIPSGVGIPHFVSHVAPEVRAKRLSLSGWFE